MNIEEYKKLSRQESAPAKGKPVKAAESVLDYDIKLFPFRLSDKSREAFYIELSTLINAGLDIKTSLEILIDEREKREEKELFGGILEKLVAGSSFSSALLETNQFSAYESYSVQIGEETGKLGVVLSQLAAFYTNRIKQRRKIISTLSYPVIVMVTAFAAVAFMLGFIVPMFEDIFSRFGGELPGLTRMIISFSKALEDNYAVFGIGLGLVVGSFWYLNRFEAVKRLVAFGLIRMPLVGPLLVTVHLERFCSSMSLLVGSRIPLLSAIDLISKMVPFIPIRESLRDIAEGIQRGESLHTCMARFPIYDKKMLALIKVGEEVNKLDYFFLQLSQRFNQETEHRTTMLGAVLEPLIIIFLGVVVAFILIAMYLPMFQMSNQIGV